MRMELIYEAEIERLYEKARLMFAIFGEVILRGDQVLCPLDEGFDDALQELNKQLDKELPNLTGKDE